MSFSPSISAKHVPNYQRQNYNNIIFSRRIHAQGNHAKMYNHPDGRAIMFEGPTYSKRRIVDFITLLEGFEEVLKIINLFYGNTLKLIIISWIIQDGPLTEKWANIFWEQKNSGNAIFIYFHEIVRLATKMVNVTFSHFDVFCYLLFPIILYEGVS